MRTLHRPLFEGILHSLHEIFAEGRAADKVLQHQFRSNRKWGGQDRKLVAEGVYDMVRWWRKLLYCCDVTWPRDDVWKATNENLHALVIEAWCGLNEVELGRGVEPRMQDLTRVQSCWNDKSLPRAVRESIPDWMDKWGALELGEQWDKMLPILNSPAPVFLRANRLKTTPQELVEKLKLENIEAETVGDDGVRLKKRSNVFISKSFHSGLFEVQDLHSQRVGAEVGVEPGLRVIDACAGAGGKTLHLAALMQNKGKIIAMDVAAKKLEQLRLRARRAGATSLEVRLIETTKVIKRLADSADLVLLDVPCSGMGILRRNPDAKWKLTPESVARVTELQREILSGYARMCKPGGTLVYATCSIMPSENSAQVQKFLSQAEMKFSLEKEKTLWPQADGPDGFYIARMKRS